VTSSNAPLVPTSDVTPKVARVTATGPSTAPVGVVFCETTAVSVPWVAEVRVRVNLERLKSPELSA
jgi:hypothetical protein